MRLTFLAALVAFASGDGPQTGTWSAFREVPRLDRTTKVGPCKVTAPAEILRVGVVPGAEVSDEATIHGSSACGTLKEVVLLGAPDVSAMVVGEGQDGWTVGLRATGPAKEPSFGVLEFLFEGGVVGIPVVIAGNTPPRPAFPSDASVEAVSAALASQLTECARKERLDGDVRLHAVFGEGGTVLAAGVSAGPALSGSSLRCFWDSLRARRFPEAEPPGEWFMDMEFEAHGSRKPT